MQQTHLKSPPKYQKRERKHTNNPSAPLHPGPPIINKTNQYQNTDPLQIQEQKQQIEITTDIYHLSR